MDKPTCRWPECERPAKSFGLCNRDAQRARRCGNLVDPWLTWVPKKAKYDECRWPECRRTDLVARGYCNPHYERGRVANDFDTPWESWYVKRVCAWCQSEFSAPMTRPNRCCGWACGTALWKREHPEQRRLQGREATLRRRARLRGADYERFSTDDVRALRGDDCYLCGEAIDFQLAWPDPLSPSLDHVVPLARGGSHTLTNAAMTHLDCNRRKFLSAPASLPPVLT